VVPFFFFETRLHVVLIIALHMLFQCRVLSSRLLEMRHFFYNVENVTLINLQAEHCRLQILADNWGSTGP
jgi:hypothetical protein